WSVPMNAPAAATLIVAADYVIDIETDDPEDVIEARLATFRESESRVITRDRDGKRREVDVRALTHSVSLAGCASSVARLNATMVAEQGRVGRPDELVWALGWETLPLRTRRARVLTREPMIPTEPAVAYEADVSAG
ncbi:MAG: hypothetical protein NZ518_08880, partial [Dehalococcoidia bacterium]|nr:hypothetical protein [Dehalococcoidia bacterium]